MPLGAAKAALLGAAGSGGDDIALEHIATATPTSGRGVTFTSIPADYHHLMIRATICTDYDSYLHFGFNTTTPTSTDEFYVTNYTSGTVGPTLSSGSDNFFGAGIMARSAGNPWVEETMVYDYATSGMATVVRRRAICSSHSLEARKMVGYLVSNPNYLLLTPVTSATYYFYDSGAEFAAGTVIDLYGLGAAI